MKKDIAGREDIDLLLEVFYSKLLADNTINYIFTDVAKIDMKTHIPILSDFWESILFDKYLYKNNAMKIHLDLHDKSLDLPGKNPLSKPHFETWLNYFNTTVDELYEGPIAFKAKERALSIATMMQIRIAQKK